MILLIKKPGRFRFFITESCIIHQFCFSLFCCISFFLFPVQSGEPKVPAKSLPVRGFQEGIKHGHDKQVSRRCGMGEAYPLEYWRQATIEGIG